MLLLLLCNGLYKGISGQTKWKFQLRLELPALAEMISEDLEAGHEEGRSDWEFCKNVVITLGLLFFFLILKSALCSSHFPQGNRS